MTTVTIVPNATITANGIVQSAPSAHAAVTDSSDVSNLVLGGDFTFELSTFTLPANSIVRSANVTGRGSIGYYSGAMISTLYTALDTQLVSFSLMFPYGINGNVTGTPAAIMVSDQAGIDGLRLNIRNSVTVTSSEYYIYLAELGVVLVYVAPPTVTVTAPTGTLTTATTTASWAYVGDVDADAGGLQQRYHVKVFSAAQYGAPGFDPATSIATYDLGEQASSVTSTSIGPLTNAVYKAYVRAAQNVNGSLQWTAWAAGAAFTINVDQPVVSTITATQTPDSDVDYLYAPLGYVSTPDTPDMAITGPVRLTVKYHLDSLASGIFAQFMHKGGGPIAEREFLMYGFGGGVALSTATPAGVQIDTAFFYDPVGSHTIGIEMTPGSTAVVSIADGVRTPMVAAAALGLPNTTFPVIIGNDQFDGRIYWAQLERLDGSGNPTGIVWRFDAEDYPGTGSSYVDPRGRTWTITAPYAILAGGAMKVTMTRDTGHVDWTHVQVERSAVDLVSWEPVRGAVAAPAPNDAVTVYDYEQPEGVDLWYRARGLIMSGSVILAQGDWKTMTAAVMWDVTGCGEWLRSVDTPTQGVMIEIIVDEATATTAHRVGLLQVIGRASPVTVWDTPSLQTGELRIATRTADAAAQLQALLRTAPVLLFQGRRDLGHGRRWVVVTQHTESRLPVVRNAWQEWREWTVTYVEVDSPPVLS